MPKAAPWGQGPVFYALHSALIKLSSVAAAPEKSGLPGDHQALQDKLHFTNEATVAQRSQATCPGPHRGLAAEPVSRLLEEKVKEADSYCPI